MYTPTAALELIASEVGDPGDLVCLRLSDGTELWRRPGLAGRSSPVVAHDLDGDGALELLHTTNGSGDGAPELVTTLRDEAVYVLDARTGALRWQFHAGGRIEAAPVAVDSDGDGRKELVIAGHDRVLQVLRTPARRGNSPQ